MEELVQELYVQFLETKEIYTETDYDATTEPQRNALISEFCSMVVSIMYEDKTQIPTTKDQINAIFGT